PPAAGMFFSLPAAKKPIRLPSADQNGYRAPSVPANSRALTCSIDRSQSMGRPPAAPALYTRARPSGERANCGTLTVWLRSREKAVFSGGKTWKLIGALGVWLTEGRAAKNNVVPKRSAAAIQAVHSRVL